MAQHSLEKKNPPMEKVQGLPFHASSCLLPIRCRYITHWLENQSVPAYMQLVILRLLIRYGRGIRHNRNQPHV